MASTRRGYSPHQTYVRKAKKLQKAGLLSSKLDLSVKPSSHTLNILYKYHDVVSGKAAVVKADTASQAADLRGKFHFKGRGKAVVIRREKGEKFRLTKSGEIQSTRPNPLNPSQKIQKTIGKGYQPRPDKGGRIYYTIPERTRGAGKIKRRTFSSFDELLYYLEKYEINFEDMEDYIEVEEFVEGSPEQTRIAEKVSSERAKATKRYKRKKARAARNA